MFINYIKPLEYFSPHAFWGQSICDVNYYGGCPPESLGTIVRFGKLDHQTNPNRLRSTVIVPYPPDMEKLEAHDLFRVIQKISLYLCPPTGRLQGS